MKKFYAVLIVLITMTGLTVFPTFGAKASTTSHLTTPKNFRRTWFQYDKNHKVHTFRFTKRTYKSDRYHATKVRMTYMKSGWWALWGVHQTAGAGERFKVSHNKLYNYYGYNKTYSNVYYASKRVAMSHLTKY